MSSHSPPPRPNPAFLTPLNPPRRSDNLPFLAPLLNETISRDDAALLVTGCDILYCILFLLFWKYVREHACRRSLLPAALNLTSPRARRYMEYKVNVVVQQTDDDNVTAGDYTVMVYGLPVDATEEGIRKHFSDLCVVPPPPPSPKTHPA